MSGVNSASDSHKRPVSFPLLTLAELSYNAGDRAMRLTTTTLMRYGTSVLSVALALLATLLVWPLVKPMASPLFLAAIVISAWRGGKGPGLLATILSRADS